MLVGRSCRLDHLVITAPSLRSGGEYVRRALGVDPEEGGEHAAMGTHNVLLRLGEDAYLEVLAVNPRAAPPHRPRWFDLDRLEAGAVPRLTTWVARTEDVDASAAASPIDLGKVETLSRGGLTWRITLPADGRLPLHGLAPALIQWSSPPPASRLQHRGVSLLRLEAFHPEPRRLEALLRCLGAEGEVSVFGIPPGGEPYLVAHLDTPAGPRRLSGRAEGIEE
jgi:glyoxalase-like protein